MVGSGTEDGPNGDTRGGDLADDRYGFSIKTGIRIKVIRRDDPTCIFFYISSGVSEF